MSKLLKAKRSNRDSRARTVISTSKTSQKHPKFKDWLCALKTDSSIPRTVERAKAIYVNKAPGVGVLSSIPIASAKGALKLMGRRSCLH